MTQEISPITPPPELVKEWATADDTVYQDLFVFCENIATQAARWGADTELEACCEWVGAISGKYGPRLRLSRRPKPPSLKELALETFNKLEHLFDGYGMDGPTIRKALESLPD